MQRIALTFYALALVAMSTTLATAAEPPSPHARVIPIANHSFEDPPVPDGEYTINEMPGWIGGGTFFHVANPRDDWFVGTSAESSLPNPIDGFNIAGVNVGAWIYQDVDTVIHPGATYTLTMLVGHRIGAPFGTPTVSLIVEGEILAQAVPNAPEEGAFSTFQLIYNSPDSGPVLGRTLRIEIRSIGADAQPWFDNLNLTVAPTPPRTPPGQVIPIANHSFEDPPVPDGEYTVNEMPGWIGGGTFFHVANPRDDWFVGTSAESSLPNPIDGFNIAGVNVGAWIYQDLAAVVQPNTTYTLTMLTGHRIGAPFGTPTVSLIAGGEVLAQAVPDEPGEGTFSTFQLIYNSPNGGSVLGRALRIEISSFGVDAQPWFDDLNLTAGNPGNPNPPAAPAAPADAAALPGTAANYDLSRDFSPTSNPNGVWTFGAKPSLDGPLSVFTVRGLNPFEYWQLVPNLEPTIYRNGTSNTIFVAGQGVFPPGTVYYYGGTDGVPNGYGAIRFTVPAAGAGQYHIETAVRPVYDGNLQGDTDFHVVKNGTELFGRFLAPPDQSGYTNTLDLAAGDTIDFMIGRGQDNHGAASGLKIQLTITQVGVPPPGQVIPIANHSFEDPPVPDGQYTVNQMPGWIGGGTFFHVANSRDDWFAGTSAGSSLPNPIDGLNIAGVNTGAWIYQDLTAVVQPNATYMLSMLIGHRIGVPVGTPTVSLIAGGEILAQAIPNAPPESRFSPFQLTYHSPASGSVLGRPLRIEIRSFGTDAQPWFDNLNLTVAPTLPPATNHAPVAIATIEPVFTLWPDESSFLVIAANGIEADVLLDGSESSDADNDPLEYLWVEEGQVSPFATGARATNSFGLGEHVVTLVVSDGQATGGDTVTFEVITLSDAVNELILFLTETELDRRNKRPLLVTLSAAGESFEEGDPGAGVKRLRVFQQKVRAQVARDNPDAAAELIAGAQQIIEAVEGLPDESSHGGK